MTIGADSGKGNTWRRVKVIIVPEGSEQEPLRFDLDGIEFHYERGVRAILPGAGEQFMRYEANGQARMQILGWKGCASFDAFEPRTEVDPVAESLRNRVLGNVERWPADVPPDTPPAKMGDGRTVAQVAAGPLPLRKRGKGAGSGGDDMV
ncbi:MAG: hypothetical protein JSU89_15455 [Myxococcales bacterium]|nr:MAG: hypothetical protein JSU89_15455 [Myxococcales bacterium]